MTYKPGDLLEDTRVEAIPERPGRLRANLSNAWNVVYVFGGTTMALAVSAARAALSQPQFDLLSATCTFLSPVSAGAIELETRTLRRGKGSEQIAVDLYEGAKEGPSVHLVASFGPKRESELTHVAAPFPGAIKPAEIPEFIPRPGASMLLMPYYHSVETRVVPSPAEAHGSAREQDQAGAPRETPWLGWLRFKNTPRTQTGELDPLAYVAACDMIAPALREVRGKKAAPVLVVSLEITLHFFARTDSEWLLQDARIYQASDGYVTGAVNLWDERQRLVAYALQRAVLRPRAF
jgi:acyl-CoA thioesterase